MTINSRALAALVVGILFGGILISSWLGWWQTESSKVAATFKEGKFAGQANPADIRGSYTFGDVEKNFGISSAVLGQAFGITSDPSAFQVKNLEGTAAESGLEIGTASVRLFVAFYKNLPFDLSTDIYLPESATALLKERDLTSEQSAYLDTHTVGIIPGEAKPAGQPDTAPQPAATSVPESSEKILKGKTTFGELLTWGIPQATVEQILGLPVPAAPSTTIKDFCTTNNLDFETIKANLQVEVDKLK